MLVESSDPAFVKTRRSNRLKWTTAMKCALLECKAKAKELVSSQELPRNANGRKKGYMAVMKELSDDCGYAEFNVSSQHLRDQAARLEKVVGDV